MENRKEEIDFFYRYRSLQGKGLFYVERMILHNEFYFTSPANINDPFDCIVDLDFSASESDWLEFFVNLSKRKNLEYNNDEHLQWAENVIASEKYKNKVIQGHLLEQLQNDINDVGLLCLSEKNDDILMWSHYADSHSGICLEIINDQSNDFLKKIYEVIYLENYEKAHAIHDGPESQINRILLSKSKCWCYETEWRIIDHENGFGLKYFDPHLLKGIIFGCRTSDENKDIIMQWLSHRESPLNLYQAHQSKNRFQLDIEQFA